MSYRNRPSYRTLDVDELSDRLEELEANRDAVEEAREELKEAQNEFDDANAQFSNACKNQVENQDEVIEALEEAVDKAKDAVEDAESALEDAESNFSEDDAEELKKLEDLRDEVGERRGRINDEGGPFVHEDDFTEYAQELCEDIGDVPRDLPSYIEIDWDRTANNLKVDYSSVEWDGDTYLYRNT